MKISEIMLTGSTKQKHDITIQDVYQLQVWIIRGNKPGKTLVITAGVHGCEYVGIQAAKELFNQIDSKTLEGNIIILPLINSQGFYEGSKQIVPQDQKNLNRVFPGKVNGSMSQQLAYWIEKEIYPIADLVVDLHGGDINEIMTPLVFFPVKADKEVMRKAKEAAQHMPVPYRIPSTATNGLYSYGVQKGVPGLLLEIGGQGKWSQEEVALCKQCIEGVMGYLGMVGTKDCYSPQKESLLTVYEEASHNGFWYPYVEAGEKVACHQMLGELKDIHDQVLATYYAKMEGVILYYTNGLGVQKGDALIAYGQV